MKFAAPIPPSITEVKPSAFTEDSTFTYLLTSLPLIEGSNFDFDLGIEFGNGSSDWAYLQIVLYTNPIIWLYLMMKKDLYPKYLRWYLQL